MASILTDRRTKIDATKNTQVEQSSVETTLVNEPVPNCQSCGSLPDFLGLLTYQISAIEAGIRASIGAMQKPWTTRAATSAGNDLAAAAQKQVTTRPTQVAR